MKTMENTPSPEQSIQEEAIGKNLATSQDSKSVSQPAEVIIKGQKVKIDEAKVDANVKADQIKKDIEVKKNDASA